jgi:hypothetical protein
MTTGEFLLRVHDRALRTSVFSGSMTRKTGRCAPLALPIDDTSGENPAKNPSLGEKNL